MSGDGLVFFACVVATASVLVEVVLARRGEEPGDRQRRLRFGYAFTAAVFVLGLISWIGLGLGECGDASENPYCDVSTATIFAAVVPGPALWVLVFGLISTESRRAGPMAVGVFGGAGSIAVFSYLAAHWSG